MIEGLAIISIILGMVVLIFFILPEHRTTVGDWQAKKLNRKASSIKSKSTYCPIEDKTTLSDGE